MNDDLVLTMIWTLVITGVFIALILIELGVSWWTEKKNEHNND
jgi:hypothetical protein